MYEMQWDDPIDMGYDPTDEEEGLVLEGFSETDEKGVLHKVIWDFVEVAKDQEYETWWCTTHKRLYQGGCV